MVVEVPCLYGLIQLYERFSTYLKVILCTLICLLIGLTYEFRQSCMEGIPSFFKSADEELFVCNVETSWDGSSAIGDGTNEGAYGFC